MEAGRGDIRPGMLMAMDPQRRQSRCRASDTTEPTFGLPATLGRSTACARRPFRGYTIVDPATVLTTHLTEILKDNLADLLSYAETQKLLTDLRQEQRS